MGARSLITRDTPELQAARKLSALKGKHDRAARIEQAAPLVANAVAANNGDLRDYQVSQIARTLRLSKDEIRDLVVSAKENLASAAVDYVSMHKQAVQAALADGQPKSLEVAIRGSQWAMENLTFDGQRVVEKTAGAGDGGTKIFIGLQLGGSNKKQGNVDVEVLDPPSPLVPQLLPSPRKP